MKSFRDLAKTSAQKKMKMYGVSSDETSASVNNAQKYGAGGCIKKADGGSVGSTELDELDGERGRSRADRGGMKKSSTTVNIIVGKGGPDASGPMAGAQMPPAPMPMPAPGGMPMRKHGGRVHLTGGADSGIGRLEKNHKK